jgi:hypothetical protein
MYNIKYSDYIHIPRRKTLPSILNKQETIKAKIKISNKIKKIQFVSYNSRRDVVLHPSVLFAPGDFVNGERKRNYLDLA